MTTNDALALIFSRNAFYQRLHYLVLVAFVLSLLVNGFLIVTFVYIYKNPARPLYFATDNVARLIQIVPVNTPNMSAEDVTAWAEEAVVAAYSYDFINYRAQLQDAQKYFTNYGWSKYMSALTASNNLLALTQRKQILIAQVVAPPKIIAQGILGGAYAWKYEMPILVTYNEPPYDGTNQFQNALVVTALVQRQNILQGYKGLGLIQLVAALATSSDAQAPQITNSPTS